MQEREKWPDLPVFRHRYFSRDVRIIFPDPGDLLQFMTRPALFVCCTCCVRLLCTDENSLGKLFEVCYNNCGTDASAEGGRSQNGFREDKLYGSKK